jgi:3-deoxy-D-manno-octulosonic-acid transferase
MPVAPGGKMPVAPRILLVDTVGELGAWWGTAQIGFVGGSLLNRRGGQSMIEPAAYGVPLCFGPETRNFRDVVKLLTENDAALVVHSGDELAAFVGRCLLEGEFAARLAENARRLVREQLGATARTLALLEPVMTRQSSDVGSRKPENRVRAA